MQKLDLSHPTEGDKLDISLLHLMAKHCAYITFGKYGYMLVQLENRGGDIPTLCVEPDSRMSRRKPLIRVRYHHPYDGFEIPGKAKTLLGYILSELSARMRSQHQYEDFNVMKMARTLTSYTLSLLGKG